MEADEQNGGTAEAGREDIAPECIYFYAMPGAHGTAEVYLYDNQGPFAEAGTQTLQNILFKLRDNALAAPNDRVWSPCGWNLGDLRWRRKAYIAIAHKTESIDEAHAVEFVGSDNKKHNSFRSPKIIEHPTNPTAPRIFCCVNHMLTKGGNPLGKNQTSRATVKVRPRGLLPIEDDTGTKMGPPVPPPAR